MSRLVAQQMITHKNGSYCLQSLIPARILMTRFILSYCAAAFKMRVNISCSQYPDEVITNSVKEMYILKHCSLNTVRTINRNLPCRNGVHRWYPLLKWLLWGSKTVCRLKSFFLFPPSIRSEAQNLAKQRTDSIPLFKFVWSMRGTTRTTRTFLWSIKYCQFSFISVSSYPNSLAISNNWRLIILSFRHFENSEQDG